MIRFAAVFAFVIVAAGCGGTESGPSVTASPDSTTSSSVTMVESGSWYAVEAWPHDGDPFVSDNFVVFSDSASAEARQYAADVAEGVWADLFELFEIGPGMLDLPPDQEKVHIYVYQDRYPLDWGARAYYGGLILRSRDHLFQSSDPADYTATMTHELVHVMSNLIFGQYALRVDVWFFEGLAETVARGTAGQAVRSLDQLEELTALYGRTSPISIKQYSQIEDPDSGENFHYPMFQLAVEFLLDDEGLGLSAVEARDLMIDATNGIPFEEAFESRVGISLDDFEEGFFELMAAYLAA